MSDFFQKPPTIGGAPNTTRDTKPNLLDLLMEAGLSPFGLGTDTKEMDPSAAQSLQRAGAGGDLLSMMIPGLAALKGLRKTPKALPAGFGGDMLPPPNLDVPSLREFMPKGAEATYARPSFRDPQDLAYDLAKKSAERRNLAAKGPIR